MDCLSMPLKTITVLANPTFLNVLNSAFFQSLAVYFAGAMQALAILTAAFFAAWYAIKSFYAQQKATRFQKVYFDDTLITQLKNLEKAISAKDLNTILLEDAVNFVSHCLINTDNIDKKTNLRYLNRTITSFNIEKHTLYFTK